MIEYVVGDFCHPVENGTVIFHACNCQGKMAAGAAAHVRKCYPVAYDRYIEDYNEGLLSLGQMSYVEHPLEMTMVVNLYTQLCYGRDGRRYTDYEAVASSLEKMINLVENLNYANAVRHGDCTPQYKNFQFPRIGCNLGNGKWEVVSAIIDTTIPDIYRKICFDLP